MYRRSIYKASGNETKCGIIISMILFIVFTSISVLTEPSRMQLQGKIIYFGLTFSLSWYLYIMIGHDILFDNVKTMRCCVYECELNWVLMELLLGKEKKGEMPANGFKIWLQGVDERGNINPIASDQIQIYEHPAEFQLESRNCELYHEIQSLRKEHIKIQEDGEDVKEFLYGEIAYVEKSKFIVGFKYLGTKNYE